MKPIRSTAQLAALLGLSRWTVSRALNGHPGLSEETVARVKETARLHGFAPSLLGRGLRTGKTNLVGICLPNLVDYFLTTKITYLQQALEAQGLHPLLQIINGEPENENAALERFAAMQCAGVVVIASALHQSAPGFRRLAAAQTPLVHIDPLNKDVTPSVSTDRHFAMAEVVRHLHKLGHRRMLAAGFSPKTTYGKSRLEGLKVGCRRAGQNYKEDIIVLPLPDAEDDFAAGEILAVEYLAKARETTAIVAINDRVAVGMTRYLAARGVSTPGKVSVVGYDNADFSPYSTPSLSTIDPQVERLIEKAVELLLNPSGKARHILVKPTFIARDSISAHKAR